MDIERLKELKAEFEQMRKYNDRHCMSTATEDDVLDVLDEAIARQSATSEDMAETIEQKLTTDAIEYLNRKMKQPFVGAGW